MSKTQAVPFALTDEELIQELTKRGQESSSIMINPQAENIVSQDLWFSYECFLYPKYRGVERPDMTAEDIEDRQARWQRILPVLIDNMEKYITRLQADRFAKEIKEQTARLTIEPAFREGGFENISIEYQTQRALVTFEADEYKITVVIKYSDIMKGKLNDIVHDFKGFTDKVLNLPMAIEVRERHYH